MAFDPDAYLAAKTGGGFDPDAYLAAKGVAVPEAPLGHEGRPYHGPNLYLGGEPGSPTPDEQLGLEHPAAKNVLPDRPLNLFGTPKGRHPMAHGSDLPRQGPTRSGAPIDESLETGPITDTRAQGNLAQRALEAPGYSTPENLSPLEATARKRTMDATPLAERETDPLNVDPILKGTVGSAEAAGAGYLLGPVLGAATRLVPALQKAEPFIQAGVEGGVGNKSQGGTFEGGAALGAGTAMLGPLARGVLNTRGAKARQFIEDHGGNVSLTTSGNGQPFEDMVTRGTKDADIGQQSVASSEKGLSMLNAQDAARKKPIGDLMARLDRSPAGEEPRNIDDLYRRFHEDVNQIGAPPRAESTLGWALDEMDRGQRGRFPGQPEVREPIVTRESSISDPTPALEKILGRRLDQASPADVKAAFNTLKANEKMADEAARFGKPIPDRQVQRALPADPRMLKESELNRIRRGVSERGQIGKSVEGSHAGERDAAGALRAAVDEGPYAGVNRDYSRAAYTNQKDRRLLGITETRKGPEESRATVERVANVIGRRGQQTITAGKDIDRLKQFETRNPEIGDELAKPGMLRAKGDLSFGLMPKQHGGLIDRTSSVGAIGAAIEAASALAGHGHVSPMKIAMGLLGAAAVKNAPAIEGRLLYPAAKALAGGGAADYAPLFAAARALKPKDKQ